MRAAAALFEHQGDQEEFASDSITYVRPVAEESEVTTKARRHKGRSRHRMPNPYLFLIFPWCSKRAAAARICWLTPKPRLLDPAPNDVAPLVPPSCLGV